MVDVHIYLNEEKYEKWLKIPKGERSKVVEKAIEDYHSGSDTIDKIKAQLDSIEREEAQRTAIKEFLKKKLEEKQKEESEKKARDEKREKKEAEEEERRKKNAALMAQIAKEEAEKKARAEKDKKQRMDKIIAIAKACTTFRTQFAVKFAQEYVEKHADEKDLLDCLKASAFANDYDFYLKDFNESLKTNKKASPEQAS